MTTYDRFRDFKNIHFYIAKVAEKFNWDIKGNAVSHIAGGLQHNRERYGTILCPCNIYYDIPQELKTREHVCPCKAFKEAPIGTTCHCGLYVKPKD